MTNIKDAKQILHQATEALADGRPVFLTDGTVTRKVIQVELTNHDLASHIKGSLDVLVEVEGWIQISMSWPWDELIGCGLTDLDGELIIAPDWWIAL